jgi:hypothetical protein
VGYERVEVIVVPTDPSPLAAALVDLERYPLLDPDGTRMREVLGWARQRLRASGACEVPDFITTAGLAALVEDAISLIARAYRSAGVGSAYLEVPDFSLPEAHPRRILGEYAVGVVAYDMFSADSPLRRLYGWDPLMHFVGAILERRPLYRYADPLGALNLAVMTSGDQLQWHFDQTDFVVSLAVQDAEDGGNFEVAPLIRNTTDERYAEVKRVLGGTSDKILRLPMRPGTLLIFEGRHSLHRVTPIRGATPRLVALLAYDTKPGTTSSDVLRLARYGRTQ